MHDHVSDSAPPSLETVEAFLARTCTPDEERAVRRWAGSAARSDLADAVRAIVRAEPFAATDPHDVVDALRARLSLPGVAVPRRRTAAVSPRRWAYVASAAFAFGLAVAGITIASRRVSTPPPRTYATAAGQCAIVTLADGSRVILAPNSTLSVSSDFGVRGRAVALVGHARFEVRHVAGAPFVVRTGDVTTRVLGTVFDVQRYQQDRMTRVIVLSGKVAAGVASRPAVTLVDHMIGRIGPVADSVVAVDHSADVSWTSGTLVFRDTPLSDVLDALGHWYGLEFRVADPALAHTHVNGTFAGENRAEALLTMQSLLGAGMTFDSTPGGIPVVTIVPRRAGQSPSRPAPSRDTRELLPISHSQSEVGR